MKALVALVTLCLSSSIAVADEKPTSDAMNEAFARYGYHIGAPTKGAHCNVSLELAQKDLVDPDHFAELQKIGILNDDLPKDIAQNKPFIVSSAFMLEMIPIATKRIYTENSDIDQCAFKQYVKYLDDYGNDAKIEAFSFTFNRALFNKINWDNFDARKVNKVFPAFRILPPLAEHMAAESQ